MVFLRVGGAGGAIEAKEENAPARRRPSITKRSTGRFFQSQKLATSRYAHFGRDQYRKSDEDAPAGSKRHAHGYDPAKAEIEGTNKEQFHTGSNTALAPRSTSR